MELTSAHLRYLLAIYEISRTHLDISSRSVAEKLGVTKPSVVRILNLLMERGMIVKEHYGKIYRTDGFIAIGCGAAEGGTLSCLRLEDGEEFYV